MKQLRFLVILWSFLIVSNLVYAVDYKDTKPDYESNIVVIKFKPEYKAQIQNHSTTSFGLRDLDRTLTAIGTTKIESRFQPNLKKYKPGLPDLTLIYQINYAKSLDPKAVAELLLQYKYLEYAEPSYIDYLMATPNDASYSLCSYLTTMQAAAAWDIFKGETDTVGVIIAIVDTGVRWIHTDIIGNIWNNLGEDADHDGTTVQYTGGTWGFDTGDVNNIDDDGNGKIDDLVGWDFLLNSSGAEGKDPSDAYGHGTTVAGLADARTNNTIGVAAIPWNVTLMPISCSYPGITSLGKGYNAFLYAAENGAKVINYSSGNANFSQANEDIVTYVNGLGCIIVAAAGNSGDTTILYPSGYPGVVSVTSVLNTGVKTSGSSYGKCIDVCTPTEGLYSTNVSGSWDTTPLASYTSYASPVAAGLTALIRAAHQDWTNAQVVNQLIASCTNIDALNPTITNLLGGGMLHAYNALSMVNPTPVQKLKIALSEVKAPSDANGNLALERNELFSLNLKVRNYAHGVSSNNVTYTLSTSDASITILNNTFVGSLPSDGYGLLTNAFSCRVSGTAVTKAVVCTLTVAADLPIVSGSSFTFSLIINAGGVFVWEGKAEAGYSGRRIRDSLTSLGYSVYYTTTFPFSFSSFSAVFLSYGMVSNSASNVTRFNTLSMYQAVKDYLMAGGRIYIEGNDATGFDMGYYLPDVGNGQTAAQMLWPLLGISAADDGANNGINGLNGQPVALTNGLSYTATTQTKLDSMDKYTPAASGAVAFNESGYGDVAIQNYGSYGQKSFVMSYCLAELTNGTAPSTRDSLLKRIMIDFTNVGSGMILNVPTVTIVRNVNSVSLSWPAVTNAVSYRIESSSDPYTGFATETTITQTSWIAPVAYPQKYYKVTARTNGL